MKISYKIQESDFLEFQLFTASKSKQIQKKKIMGWIFIIILSVTLGLYFFYQDNLAMIIYFTLTTVIFGIFYPKYFNWRYKKHYKNHIKENYKNRFELIENIEFTPEYINSHSKIGEGKINISEVEEVNETSRHFFLKISTGMSLIIPKKEINEVDKLREEFKNIGLVINDELNWNSTI